EGQGRPAEGEGARQVVGAVPAGGLNLEGKRKKEKGKRGKQGSVDSAFFLLPSSFFLPPCLPGWKTISVTGAAAACTACDGGAGPRRASASASPAASTSTSPPTITSAWRPTRASPAPRRPPPDGSAAAPGPRRWSPGTCRRCAASNATSPAGRRPR